MLLPANLPPGLMANGTDLQSAGRYRSANLIRFFNGKRGPIGGWRKRSTAQVALSGVCRAVFPWSQNTGGRWIGLGTHRHLYVQTAGGTITDITPIRRSQALGANPITTVLGSHTITVADVAHAALVGDTVTLAGATATGGLTIGQLNAVFTIVTVPTANSWTATTTGLAATSGATAGGAGVTAKYQISPGRADAATKRGYGASFYGKGTYGSPRPDTGTVTPAAVWAEDTFGENLIACPDWQGGLYQWALDVATPAVVLSGAPTGCGSVMVTGEGFVMGLKGRTAIWSDQRDASTWVPASTNQAGDFDLATSGTIQVGVRMKGVHLILTTVDAWTATYADPTFVYNFQRIGEGCGAVSRKALIATDEKAAWMAADGFYAYDGGAVQKVPCEVADYVFGSFNSAQKSKVWAEHRAQFSEVWWHYPSGSSLEVDRYCCWNYAENHWTYGQMARTAGVDKGVFSAPILVSSDGYIYDHELGFAWDGAVPFLKTGPIVQPSTYSAMQALGGPDYLMELQRVVPDETAAGDVTVTVGVRLLPELAETTYGPYSPAAGLISPLVQGSQFTLRFDATVVSDFSIGNYALDLIKGDPLF